MKQKMFFGASPIIFERANQLRKNMTAAEKCLWGYLKKGLSGHKFRRQHALGTFIVDFYCHSAKLVIELDGSIHNRVDVKENDTFRQRTIEAEGLKVLRFSNSEVMNNISEVIKAIESTLFEM